MNFKKNKIILLLSSLLILSSCSSNKAPIQKPISSSPITNEQVNTIENQDISTKTNNSVFFDFDKYNIKDQYIEIINDNSKYLSINPTAKVQINGNTDDIGSVEYNLSLGQKRADIVKKALVSNGVNQKNIEAISNGKLKPIMANDNDSGRAYNRRADIVYLVGQPSWYVINSNTNEVPVNINYTK